MVSKRTWSQSEQGRPAQASTVSADDDLKLGSEGELSVRGDIGPKDTKLGLDQPAQK